MKRSCLFFAIVLCCSQALAVGTSSWETTGSDVGEIGALFITKTTTSNLYAAIGNYNVYTTYDLSAPTITWNGYSFLNTYLILNMAASKQDQNVIYVVMYCTT